MSIATELTRMAQNAASVDAAKTAIASAITAKGGTVGQSDGLEDFPDAIEGIPSGGNNCYFSGTLLLNNVETRDIVIPIDTSNFDNYVFYIWVNRTGKIIDGELVWNQVAEVPGTGKSWFAYAYGISTKTDLFPATPVLYFNTGEMNASKRPANQANTSYWIKNVNNGGIDGHIIPSKVTGGLRLLQNNPSYFFCFNGFAVEYNYRVWGICGSGVKWQAPQGG